MESLILILVIHAVNSVQAKVCHFSVPLEIRNAYTGKTRSGQGNPGARYWQNVARYAIVAETDTMQNVLNGRELITCINKSPGSLDKIVIRQVAPGNRRGPGVDRSSNLFMFK